MDAQTENGLHCTAENSLPLPKFYQMSSIIMIYHPGPSSFVLLVKYSMGKPEPGEKRKTHWRPLSTDVSCPSMRGHPRRK